LSAVVEDFYRKIRENFNSSICLQGWAYWERFAGKSQCPIRQFGVLVLSQSRKTFWLAGLALNVLEPPWLKRLPSLRKSWSLRAMAGEDAGRLKDHQKTVHLRTTFYKRI
jgi:hypothetical protein